MEREISHLEELIQDKKEQIVYNLDYIKKGSNVIFYNNWNRDLEIEIKAFELALAQYKSLKEVA